MHSFSDPPIKKKMDMELERMSIAINVVIHNFFCFAGLKSCRESRPPIRTDLDGPTPCTYSAMFPTKAVHGTKISPKTKYARSQ